MAAYYFLLHPKLQSCKDKKDTELIDCVQQILYDTAGRTKFFLRTNLDEAGREVDARIVSALDSLKNIIFSEEMQSALESIASSIEQLKEFDMDAQTYATPVILLFAILKRVQNTD